MTVLDNKIFPGNIGSHYAKGHSIRILNSIDKVNKTCTYEQKGGVKVTVSLTQWQHWIRTAKSVFSPKTVS